MLETESLHIFKTRLGRYLGLNFELVINENRSTMLNLLEKRGSFVRLSVHKMFLDAPDVVISAIAHYVQGLRKEKNSRNLILRKYIQEHLAQADYTHLVKQHRLTHQGTVYHLKKIYDEINEKYFCQQLDLSITWYGQSRGPSRTRITFGQYVSGLRLIKIHRMLDDSFFPDYFVSFVVYHEMLHCVIPGSVDRRGRFCFHGLDFKQRERVFEQYAEARLWERENRAILY